MLPTTGSPVVDWIIYVGAAVSALTVIWRKMLRPLARWYNSVASYGSVLEDIAKQFKSDSGSTLKDNLNRLEVAATKSLQAIAAADLRAVEEAKTLARLELALAVLEGRLTGGVRSEAPIAQAAEAAADKVKATAADAAAALVEVVNPEPIKVEVINPDPIDVNVNEPR
jgi:hypothetical protein